MRVYHPVLDDMEDDSGPLTYPPATTTKKKRTAGVSAQPITTQPAKSTPIKPAPVKTTSVKAKPVKPQPTELQPFSTAQAITIAAPHDWVNVPTAPTPPTPSEMNYHQLLESRISALERASDRQLREIGVYQERYRLVKGQLEIALRENIALKEECT